MPLNLLPEDDWVPASCTLPTAEQPLRRREFDDLFARDAVTVTQTSVTEVRIELRAEPDVAARAAGLAAKETGCCSFFTFDLIIGDGQVALVVSTPPEHERVLAALAARADAHVGTQP